MFVISLLMRITRSQIENIIIPGSRRPDLRLLHLGRQHSGLFAQRGLGLEETDEVFLFASGSLLGCMSFVSDVRGVCAFREVDALCAVQLENLSNSGN